MKIEAVRNLLTRGALPLVTTLAGALCINANAELVYGVSDSLGTLITFDSATPQNVLTAHSISGLQSGEQIRGIDFVGGTMYGLGSQSHLYTINPNTAAATQVGSGQFSPLLNGSDFGFNAAGSTFFVCSDLGQNMILQTFGVGSAGPNYTAGSSIDGMAYDHVTGAFYGISASSHNWLGLDPTHGAVTTIGPTGVNFADRLALDISPITDIAYFSGTVAGQTDFFTVNKTTGALSLVGTVGTPGQFSSGLDAIVVVPEPSSVALFAVGGLLFGLLMRKK
jgi:Domain of unknown function (DUF4394)/PEP-CTERM motif